MIFARLRPATLLFTLSLLAGCRSEQIAFDFRTPVGAGPGARSQAARPATPAAEPLPAAAPVAEAVPARALGAAAAPLAPRRAKSRQRVALAAALRPAVLPMALLRLRPHRRATGALARTQRTAEAGLGRTVLFFVGVILGVLAGLAALVNLIFGLGFFTALGYTAAGLVVLYLLYNLFSPKKKA